MKVPKIIISVIALLFSSNSFSQDFSNLWKGHFSFNNIIDVAQGNNKIIAASENAIFTYDLTSNEVDEISSINGLSGESISNIHYSEAYGLLLIGYQNGLIQIVSDSSDDVLTVVDILDKETIPPTNKKINHFNEHNEVVYISTDYGISVYDLQNLEFGDSYFIGDLGSQKIINQTTIFGDYIYTTSATGIQKALVNNSNLIDYQQWQLVRPFNWSSIESVNNKLYVVLTSNGNLYELVNDVAMLRESYNSVPVDLKSVGDLLVVVINTVMYLYDSDLTLVSSSSVSPEFNSLFTSGIVDSDNNFYIGTRDFGILKKIQGAAEYEEIHPNGPLLNNIFSIETVGDNLWAVFGGYSITYSFSGAITRSGISHYTDDEWVNISYDTIANVVTNPFFLSHVTPNPLNPEQCFVSSYYSGLLEVNDNQVTGIYNQDNSTILPFAGNLHLTLEGTYDSNNTLWALNGRVNEALNKFENNQWTSYSFQELIDPATSNLGFSSIAIDNQGTKFIGTYRLGLLGFNENGGNPLIANIEEGDDEGNLPGNTVNTVAVDTRNQLWIGTNKGLRVLFNTSDFFTNENVTARAIIILEDGVPKELLFQQFISDIEVDGANNKWVGTISSGLFYFSPDGQETIFHFTKDNSPLPSNNITDITIDQENGRVYIGTDNGLVSFKAGGSAPKEELANAFIYPNPVRPSFNIADERVKIKDITENVNIKITDIEGNLVAEAQSKINSRYNGYNLEIDGGTAFWNGRNLANNIVSSGVYLVMLSDLDTFETTVLKLMVVR